MTICSWMGSLCHISVRPLNYKISYCKNYPDPRCIISLWWFCRSILSQLLYHQLHSSSAISRYLPSSSREFSCNSIRKRSPTHRLTWKHRSWILPSLAWAGRFIRRARTSPLHHWKWNWVFSAVSLRCLPLRPTIHRSHCKCIRSYPLRLLNPVCHCFILVQNEKEFRRFFALRDKIIGHYGRLVAYMPGTFLRKGGESGSFHRFHSAQARLTCISLPQPPTCCRYPRYTTRSSLYLHPQLFGVRDFPGRAIS